MRSLSFVVGTGRCGSTALSRVLARHPEVLSVSELLASLAPHALPAEPLSGATFWRLLAGPNPFFDAMLRAGVTIPEFCYPAATGRFDADTGIPAISMMTLPGLTDDPDALFDLLAARVPQWPSRPVSAHYEALFTLLSARYGGAAVVERSGFSLQWVTDLARRFPDARLVHMFRDGPDCALSMSRHPGFRLIALEQRIKTMTGVRTIPELTAEQVSTLPAELAAVLPDRFDPAALRHPVPLAEFADLWSRLVCDGVADLAAIPGPRRMALRYEDLLASPADELTRLAEFLQVSKNPAWLAEAGALLHDRRVGTADALPAAELAVLRERCAPGRQALQQMGDLAR